MATHPAAMGTLTLLWGAVMPETIQYNGEVRALHLWKKRSLGLTKFFLFSVPDSVGASWAMQRRGLRHGSEREALAVARGEYEGSNNDHFLIARRPLIPRMRTRFLCILCSNLIMLV